MTKSDTILPECYRLNSENFDFWYRRIRDLLRMKNLMVYIESDYLSEVRGKVQDGIMSNDDLQKAIKDQANADFIIINNLSVEAFEMVKDLETPFETFKILKQEYDKNETKDVQQWLEKLRNLKARNPRECDAVLRKIKEIFNILEKKGYAICNMEKLRFIYYAMPPIIQSDIKFKGDENVDETFKTVSAYAAMREYYLTGKNTTITIENKSRQKPEMMDIDYVSETKVPNQNQEISYMKKGNTFNGNSYYCLICNEKGHDLHHCKFNLRNPNRNNDNYKKRHSRKGKNTHHDNNKKKNRKYIGNFEHENDSSSEDIPFNDITPTLKAEIDNIEIF